MRKRHSNPRLLVLRSGSGPGNNLIRALRAGLASCRIVGTHDDAFYLRRSVADRNYLLPPVTGRQFLSVVKRLIDAEKIDLVIPNSEADVKSISDLRDKLPCKVFLPRTEVIEKCSDKYELAVLLRRNGLPVPPTYPITALNDADRLYRSLPKGLQLWCRIRRGSGSVGAIPVKNAAQVRHWIKYWQEMRAIPPGSFTLSEYLPGRDYCVESIWKDGRLVATKMHQRLAYFVAGSNASGVSSSAAVAKMVSIPGVFNISSKAIRALDPKASGVFFVDLKEDAKGKPCITEINAGRFANVSTIHDITAKRNMAAIYVRVALGQDVRFDAPSERVGSGQFVLRDLDTIPLNVTGGISSKRASWL